MRIRRDGEETRQRILDAACAVFGQKGYRGATHVEICRRAGTNTAAINYHFGSKEELYRSAWRHAVSAADEMNPPDGGVSGDASPAERLRGNIYALVRFMSDSGQLGSLHHIRMMELSNPTGILDDDISERIASLRSYTRGILCDLLGPDATDRDVELCEVSIISQCHVAGVHRQGGPMKKFWRFVFEDVDSFVDHVWSFSMAGIDALRGEIESRERG